MPKYCAAREYITAILFFSKGIPLARPTNHAVVFSPIIIYPVGRGSILYFFTSRAANACAPEIKYGSSEFNNEVNKMASAFGETPVTLPGNRIIGIEIIVFIDDTNLSKSNWSIADEPPTKIAEAPSNSTLFAT